MVSCCLINYKEGCSRDNLKTGPHTLLLAEDLRAMQWHTRPEIDLTIFSVEVINSKLAKYHIPCSANMAPVSIEEYSVRNADSSAV